MPTVTTATIKHRQPIQRPDGDWERVKMVVYINDGTRRDDWPYVKKETQTDKQLTDAAKARVQASLDSDAEAIANAPVDREELDAVLLELQKAGKIESDNWPDLKDEAIGVGP